MHNTHCQRERNLFRLCLSEPPHINQMLEKFASRRQLEHDVVLVPCGGLPVVSTVYEAKCAAMRGPRDTDEQT